jgi:hypothetical protein
MSDESRLILSLPREGRAEVGVFDLAGQRVKTLATGTHPAGHHALAWDGRDGSGKRAAAGVYFLRAEAAGETLTRKLILLD